MNIDMLNSIFKDGVYKNTLMDFKLITLFEFQEKYPTSHVGGSIGLMLRGIDLGRNLSKSDLDITIDEYDFKEGDIEDLDLRSDFNDFDFCLVKKSDESMYVKIDIRVSPEPSFDVIEYKGVKYNVSKLRDIIFWKKNYAEKGVQKHINDLKVIKLIM